MLLITEDWYALSHYRPLIQIQSHFAREVVIVTRSSGRTGELETLGARVVDFDYHRSSMNPIRESISVSRLARILRRERPDVLHMVSMKPIVLGGLALKIAGVPHLVVQLTGLGLLGIAQRLSLRLFRAGALSLMAWMLRKPSSFLLVQNPDDLAFLTDSGVVGPGTRLSVLGGAGVDPSMYSPLPQPNAPAPTAAFVGRMINSKGVDVLMNAADLLAQRALPLALDLYGSTDEGNPQSIQPHVLREWCARTGASWHGHVDDVRAVWSKADICVLPARGGEGLPRALLEAAACARPLVVTDVPGCRHFVRHGIEGLVVPPEDPDALADALERLARNPDLRARMGQAARRRVLEGFTVAHARNTFHAAYLALLDDTRFPSRPTTVRQVSEVQ